MNEIADIQSDKVLSGANPPCSRVSSDRGNISVSAIRYAATLMDGRLLRTQQRLYMYNSVPLTPFYSRIFGRPLDVRHLLLASAGLHSSERSNEYSVTAYQGWLIWKDTRPRRFVPSPGGTIKLYLAPKLDYLPSVLRCLAGLCRKLQIPSFKVGADLANLRRPDRVVIYLRDFEQFEEACYRFRELTEGIPYCAVPFAEHLSGMLFTGIDPPLNEITSSDSNLSIEKGSRSWRGWITQKLAKVLHQQVFPSVGIAVDQALAALRSFGIDSSDWSVPKDFWLRQNGKGL